MSTEKRTLIPASPEEQAAMREIYPNGLPPGSLNAQIAAEMVLPPGVEATPIWPPVLITKWLQMETIATDALVRELRLWADWFESDASDEDKGWIPTEKVRRERQRGVRAVKEA